MEFVRRLMNDPAGPSRDEKGIVAAFCSLLNSCGFCFGARKNVRPALGVDEELFGKLMDDTAPANDKLKPILKCVRKLTLAPGRMTEEDAKACYRAWRSEQDLTIAVRAIWNWFNRMILGHGIDKKRDEEAFRARGAPEKMAQGCKSYYDEKVAAGIRPARGESSRRGFDASSGRRQGVPRWAVGLTTDSRTAGTAGLLGAGT